MNYEQSLEYIHGISWTFCKPGLERIGELCERLGHPERNLKFVHVAGTNGKGSFCSMLDSVLREAGYKVGLYTSPYIKRFNERMRVSGKDIEDEVLARITSEVRPIADSMTDKPTEFELITAVAFKYFAEEECDVVILEAGMGGRLDSTNIIDTPVLSVITGIALDHTAFLGDTVEKIAREKAGIIKPNIPILYGGEDDEARAVIKEKAKEQKSRYREVDYSLIKLNSATLSGSDLDYKSHTGVHINLLGLYQPKNTAVVLEAIDSLRESGFAVSEEAIKKGLEKAKWHARFEIIKKTPLTIFDGAHNPQGVESAVKSIKHYFNDRKVCILSGVLSDKDYNYIARKLSEVASAVYTITPDNPRALSAEEYASVISRNGVKAIPCKDIEEAFTLASDEARDKNIPLISLGSLYTYVDIIKLI